jgi:hypothetical protein
MESLGELEGVTHHIVALLGRGRLQQGKLSEGSQKAAVLLVLRGPGPGSSPISHTIPAWVPMRLDTMMGSRATFIPTDFTQTIVLLPAIAAPIAFSQRYLLVGRPLDG